MMQLNSRVTHKKSTYFY